jgi:hypothetical protein
MKINFKVQLTKKVILKNSKIDGKNQNSHLSDDKFLIDEKNLQICCILY